MQNSLIYTIGNSIEFEKMIELNDFYNLPDFFESKYHNLVLLEMSNLNFKRVLNKLTEEEIYLKNFLYDINVLFSLVSILLTEKITNFYIVKNINSLNKLDQKKFILFFSDIINLIHNKNSFIYSDNKIDLKTEHKDFLNQRLITKENKMNTIIPYDLLKDIMEFVDINNTNKDLKLIKEKNKIIADIAKSRILNNNLETIKRHDEIILLSNCIQNILKKTIFENNLKLKDLINSLILLIEYINKFNIN